MKKVDFELGQEVIIEGKFVNAGVWGFEVEEKKAQIILTGQPEISRKYKVVKFDEPKYGIVVGVRSIVESRIHYFDGEIVNTKTFRQPAVVVACDLRGQYLVPVYMVHDFYDWELSSEQLSI